MVVLALRYPKFIVVFFLWFFVPALSIQLMDTGDISVTGTVHIGHSSACGSVPETNIQNFLFNLSLYYCFFFN